MGANNPKIHHFPLSHMDPPLYINAWAHPLTTPNDSSIGSRTSTQLRNKGPTGYNWTPHVHPQNCNDNHPHLIPQPTPLTTPNGIQICSAILP